MTVELQATSNYSFLRGGSHVEELFARAAVLGLKALAITDHATLAGIPRAHRAARESGVRLIAGCRLDLEDGTALLVYPADRPAWSRLCRLLGEGRKDRKKGCILSRANVCEYGEGWLAVLLAEVADGALAERLAWLRGEFGARAHLALTPRRLPGEAVRLHDLAAAARAARVPIVATGDVLYHHPSRHLLQDVLTCIREGVSIDAAGFRLARHAGRHLMGGEERAHLLARHPEALENAEILAGRCRFSLDELRYQYPDESAEFAGTPQQHLEHLLARHLPDRYPDGAPEGVRRQIAHECTLIAELQYALYFLTVYAIVAEARRRGILCQGRGSAANSAVCYVLGITEIDPVRSGLLFERFISRARHEPPDIDVDFEHERREEIIQWIYDHYGRAHAALTATVACYHTRGAIRDVGKVMGLTEDVTAALASQASHWDKEGISDEQAAELGLDPGARRLALTLRLSHELIGFPRTLGTHPGGFVLTRDRLDELVPVVPAAMEGRQIIEWDKDDISGLGFMKVDVLALGMLGCLHRCFDLIEHHRGQRLRIATIPPEDRATYAMIQRADTLGTFQIESRAQMAMLPRLKPERFYDLVIEVAIVRPGPIQGEMVHPYLRRRRGEEAVDYPSPALERVLGKTLGVPLFQEQAMQVAIVCAGFTPTEADQLRRSMATFKFQGEVSAFRDKLVAGMLERGYRRDFAEQIFRQIEGFGSYGFPESHAASFALIAYASSWLKCHHPDAFAAALLNARPMGFYAPAQVVRDARAHGVEVRAVSVNASRWECTLEPASGKFLALRLGLSFVKGLGVEDAADLVAARGEGAFASAADLARRTGLAREALEHLAEADAFAPLGQDRRAALWDISAIAAAPLPLFAAAGEAREPAVALAPLPEGGEIVEDYRSSGLTLRRHPLALLRGDLLSKRIRPCASLGDLRDGARAAIAGLILVRQRPGSAGGVTFVTLEDESGFANVVVWARLFEAQRRVLLGASLIACHGRVQREGSVIHLIVERLEDLSPLLAGLGTRGAGIAAPGETLKVTTRDFR